MLARSSSALPSSVFTLGPKSMCLFSELLFDMFKLGPKAVRFGVAASCQHVSPRPQRCQFSAQWLFIRICLISVPKLSVSFLARLSIIFSPTPKVVYSLILITIIISRRGPRRSSACRRRVTTRRTPRTMRRMMRPRAPRKRSPRRSPPRSRRRNPPLTSGTTSRYVSCQRAPVRATPHPQDLQKGKLRK